LHFLFMHRGLWTERCGLLARKQASLENGIVQ
jgi:hypothetical protein